VLWRDTKDILLPWKLSAHLRMGFFLHQHADLMRFLYKKLYCTKIVHSFQETVEWQQAHCPMLGRSLTLINSILLVDDDLAVHYANPAAQQLLAQSSRKLFGTPPELLSYFSLNIGLMQEPAAGQGLPITK
jgi:hypothetical protein